MYVIAPQMWEQNIEKKCETYQQHGELEPLELDDMLVRVPCKRVRGVWVRDGIYPPNGGMARYERICSCNTHA